MAVENIRTHIRRLWQKFDAAAPANGDMTQRSEAAIALEEQARRYDGILAANIKPHLDRYAEGLISANDLLDLLEIEGGKTVGV